MPHHPTTDERLRYHLDTNQPMRERLCAALLPLAGPYSDIRLRRPRGGPDGGRDIEAIYAVSISVWGGVGFQNSANDSPKQKAAVRKKFRADVDRALSENPNLKGFIFFTNVDLTPGEETARKADAKAKGIEFVDVFHRERLRDLLDSPAGLGFRFRYLDIPLSKSEQVAFFSHYGSQLEKMVSQGFETIDRKLRRIEFFHDCSKPLMGGSLFVELTREYTPEELGHFRVLAQILNMHEDDPHPALYLAGRDGYSVIHSGDDEGKVIGTTSIAWSRNPDQNIQKTNFSQMQPATNYLDFGAHLHRRGPFPTLGSLDQRWLSVFVTKPLLAQVRGIGLIFNGYVVGAHLAEEFVILEQEPLIEWPAELSEEERRVPWVNVMLKNPAPVVALPGAERMGWSLRFDEYTPEKERPLM